MTDGGILLRADFLSPVRSAALALLVLLAVPAASSAAPLVCDGSSAVTLFGLDTSTGRMLFSVPPLGGQGGSWLVEVNASGDSARAWTDLPRGLFGGSTGPGPVLAVVPCGASCVQPVRWEHGTWKPLGEALTLPTAANVTLTYDLSGVPWVVAHGPSNTDGYVQAWAFRLKGRDWESRGSLAVTALGEPPALPAPQRKDGILTGSGLFSASGRPEPWVAALPTLARDRQGQVLAVTGTSSAYLSADGVIYLSDDSGKSWRRSLWNPWGTTSTAGLWRQGSDYWVDLPYGDHKGSLRLVWFDRRIPNEEKLILTRLAPGGEWERLAETRSDVRSKNESLLLSQVLVPQADTWFLLSGCAATADGSHLVVRVFDRNGLSSSKLVPLRQGHQ